MDYDNVKLNLKKSDKQIAELEKVKARAEIRTKRRILEVQENERMEELEQEVIARAKADAEKAIERRAAEREEAKKVSKTSKS